ncbi:MAG: hypothetical protein ACTSYI_13295, partial [Promethearchaeota archaeon]
MIIDSETLLPHKMLVASHLEIHLKIIKSVKKPIDLHQEAQILSSPLIDEKFLNSVEYRECFSDYNVV